MEKGPEIAEEINAIFAELTAELRLAKVAGWDKGRVVFTTSFGMEDQILTHMICSQGLDIDIVTLDTGRMFEETYKVWADTESTYKVKIKAFFPLHEDVEAMTKAQGINGFYDSVANRKECCRIRKVVPLGRALEGGDHWITGIRAEQSSSRSDLKYVEYLADKSLIKSNPLLDWSKADMHEYLKANSEIPVNSLHAKGFPSIGCAPCTRAVMAGEEDRAGRWWWEDDNQECGLHVGEDGRLVRTPKSPKEVI